MPLLIKLGICELAVGVLSGWAMIAMVERPEALKRFGVRQLARIRQTHLDLDRDPPHTRRLRGAAHLGVLACHPELRKGSIVYRGLNTAVVAGFTVAWVVLAVTVLSR